MKLPFKLPKIHFTKVRKIIIVFLLTIGIFSGGYFLGVNGYKASINKLTGLKVEKQIPPDKTNVDFSLFWRVWDVLQQSYFDQSKLNQGKMVYGAIQGMVASLGDPYTSFLTPPENKVIEEDLSGSFDGVGIQIGYKGTQLAVVTPLPDSPAQKAGVLPGDFIIGIKDEAKKLDIGTVGLSLTEAVQYIRGPKGTKVTLTLLRDGVAQPIIVDLIRTTVNVPSLILNFVGNDKSIAHIQLLKFGGETDAEWQKAVDEILKDKNATKIILDLRGNPGGYLQSAVDIAGEFVKTGSVAVIEERGDGTRHEYQTDRIGLLTNYPMVVLINGGSASASEILAGALRDIKKVKLIGEKSFGKGTIQEPQQLDGGTGLHITIAKWLTPGGTWVNDKGLEPDVKIENDVKSTEDLQLNKAIETVNKLQ
jgi:carboxyl-terminal processing protease